MKTLVIISFLVAAGSPIFVGAQQAEADQKKPDFSLNVGIQAGPSSAQTEKKADEAVKAVQTKTLDFVATEVQKVEMAKSIANLKAKRKELEAATRAPIGTKGAELLTSRYLGVHRELGETRKQLIDVRVEQVNAEKKSDEAKIELLQSELSASELEVALLSLSVKVLENAQSAALEVLSGSDKVPPPNFQRVNETIAKIDSKLSEVRAQLAQSPVSKGTVKEDLARTQVLAQKATEIYQKGVALREQNTELADSNKALGGKLDAALVSLKKSEDSLLQLDQILTEKKAENAQLVGKVTSQEKTISELTSVVVARSLDLQTSSNQLARVSALRKVIDDEFAKEAAHEAAKKNGFGGWISTWGSYDLDKAKIQKAREEIQAIEAAEKAAKEESEKKTAPDYRSRPIFTV